MGHAVTLGVPPTQSPSELPSPEQVGVVSPVNSPQPPASLPELPELLPLEAPLLLPLEPPLLLEPLEAELPLDEPLVPPLEVLLVPELPPLLLETPASAWEALPASLPGPPPVDPDEEQAATAARDMARATQRRGIARPLGARIAPESLTGIVRSFLATPSRQLPFPRAPPRRARGLPLPEKEAGGDGEREHDDEGKHPAPFEGGAASGGPCTTRDHGS